MIPSGLFPFIEFLAKQRTAALTVGRHAGTQGSGPARTFACTWIRRFYAQRQASFYVSPIRVSRCAGTHGCGHACSAACRMAGIPASRIAGVRFCRTQMTSCGLPGAMQRMTLKRPMHRRSPLMLWINERPRCYELEWGNLTMERPGTSPHVINSKSWRDSLIKAGSLVLAQSTHGVKHFV